MSSLNAVEIFDLWKSFGTIAALRGVNLTLKKGEVLALLGDNGAGKSTLIKILSGVYPPDKGDVYINDEKINFSSFSVAYARSKGVETVYQERSLAEHQPLWRNLFVGRPLKNAFGLIDVKREKKESMKLLSEVLGLKGVGLYPEASVSTLSGGERQALAIARALYFNASIIILDEPTTALAVSEVEKVLNFIGQIRKTGKSCLFISHELHHVYRIADRFAILNRGTITAILEKKDTSFDKLLHLLMV